MKKIIVFLIWLTAITAQKKILINMDESQTNHLKAYGVVFNSIRDGKTAEWLLNYKGGSFLVDYDDETMIRCRLKNVSCSTIQGNDLISLYEFLQSEENNTDLVKLEKAPKIAVYVTPEHKPWDDAVTLALDYAEISYDKIWIKEILDGKLNGYDWLHLHHEDFTGQYGKFYSSYQGAQWYLKQQQLYEGMASQMGFQKVSAMELAVVLEIKSFVANGGFLFAMCSGTDSFDIAAAAENIDIVDQMFDKDAPDPDAQNKLDYKKTLAFENFKLEMNPYVYEYSDIDIQFEEIGLEDNDYFTLFEFSAKQDPVPTMLTQNHTGLIRGFMGQTTMFRRETIKKSVVIMGEREGTNQVRYIHGNFGKGMFTFYGGHDPEDYKHLVGEKPTELSLFPNSPGYRLILNNILFPAAKKKEQKT